MSVPSKEKVRAYALEQCEYDGHLEHREAYIEGFEAGIEYVGGLLEKELSGVECLMYAQGAKK